MSITNRQISLGIILLSLIYSGYITTNTDFRAGTIYLLLSLVSLVVYALWDIMFKGEEISDFGKKNNLIVGIVFAVLFGIISAIAPSLSVLTPKNVLGFSSIGNLAYISALVPFVEEYMFRGWIFALINKFFGVWIATIGSSLLFTIYHSLAYGLTYTFFIGALVFGLVASIVTILTGGLGSSIIMHSANNTIKFIKDNSLLMIVS